LYLLGYEIMFRGFLLFSCLNEMNILSAIAINISIYALIHIPKGFKEVAGSLPLGILLCLMTIYTGTIWAAFMTHGILALSNEWFSLKYHPEISIKNIFS
jgi:membrane protease YdiL (CAAX protease family)